MFVPRFHCANKCSQHLGSIGEDVLGDIPNICWWWYFRNWNLSSVQRKEPVIIYEAKKVLLEEGERIYLFFLLYGRIWFHWLCLLVWVTKTLTRRDLWCELWPVHLGLLIIGTLWSTGFQSSFWNIASMSGIMDMKVFFYPWTSR